jgi:hypothetical protein
MSVEHTIGLTGGALLVIYLFVALTPRLVLARPR